VSSTPVSQCTKKITHLSDLYHNSPVADADVYIDYYNTGNNQKMISVDALQSVKITDDDQDMSGAVIFAVKRGGPKYGDPVDIAVAYGQDPLVSGPLQPISMDLGTTVLPLPLIKVKKLVDKVIVVPGEWCSVWGGWFRWLGSKCRC
jgi:hypothetical protein